MQNVRKSIHKLCSVLRTLNEKSILKEKSTFHDGRSTCNVFGPKQIPQQHEPKEQTLYLSSTAWYGQRCDVMT